MSFLRSSTDGKMVRPRCIEPQISQMSADKSAALAVVLCGNLRYLRFYSS